jgi:hypothetical protein
MPNVKLLREELRKILKHPTGVRFSDNPMGTSWPNDQFTTRRIRDGDIAVVEDKSPGGEPPVT